jgi:coenzyme F420-reducing hydrogenase alpha subunit
MTVMFPSASHAKARVASADKTQNVVVDDTFSRFNSIAKVADVVKNHRLHRRRFLDMLNSPAEKDVRRVAVKTYDTVPLSIAIAKKRMLWFVNRNGVPEPK